MFRQVSEKRERSKSFTSSSCSNRMIALDRDDWEILHNSADSEKLWVSATLRKNLMP